MAENTYRHLKPVEIIEYLCQGAANGFQASALEAAEKLESCASGTFTACSDIDKRGKSESLQTLWYGHHLKAEPPLRTPSFQRKTKEKETAPQGLKAFQNNGVLYCIGF